GSLATADAVAAMRARRARDRCRPPRGAPRPGRSSLEPPVRVVPPAVALGLGTVAGAGAPKNRDQRQQAGRVAGPAARLGAGDPRRKPWQGPHLGPAMAGGARSLWAATNGT